MLNKRDIEIIKKIEKYCQSIERIKDKFAHNIEMFEQEEVLQAAAGMFVMQIGELAKNLSDEFINEHQDIPWNQIKGLHNIYAHEYHHIDSSMIWDTIIYDIPELKTFCKKVLSE